MEPSSRVQLCRLWNSHGTYFYAPTRVTYVADSFNDRVVRIDPWGKL
jgi:hypothetical protein